jgi:hypothetical protein
MVVVNICATQNTTELEQYVLMQDEFVHRLWLNKVYSGHVSISDVVAPNGNRVNLE